MYLYKIITQELWGESQQSPHILLADEDDHFIHLSTEEQLPRILKKYWEDRPYFILKLDTRLLIGELRLEANEGGVNKYYHLYRGKIPKEAVLEVFS